MHQDIKIGTVVKGSENPVEYIKQILPYGFESFSLTFWQTLGDTDLKKLADELMPILNKSGAVISTLGMFGNPLEEKETDIETLKAFEQVIDAAPLFETNIVSGFTGRLRGKAIDESMEQFKKIWSPLAERAQKNGVRIAFENCDMGGTWSTGDWNIAHNPTAWQMMFEAVTCDNLGLEWEPCHQMVSLIDPMPQLREWVDKIFHVHGKDATIHWDVIKKYGIHTAMHADIALPASIQTAPPFAYHRTPGFGDSDWTAIISDLCAGGFTGAIDIEGWHDPVYKDDLEMTGQVHALNYLKQCRGGKYIQNPKV